MIIRFQYTKDKLNNWRSQFVTLKLDSENTWGETYKIFTLCIHRMINVNLIFFAYFIFFDILGIYIII